MHFHTAKIQNVTITPADSLMPLFPVNPAPNPIPILRGSQNFFITDLVRPFLGLHENRLTL